jgi:hypothetical protein
LLIGRIPTTLGQTDPIDQKIGKIMLSPRWRSREAYLRAQAMSEP